MTHKNMSFARGTLLFFSLLIGMFAFSPAQAQEGHPMAGSWVGDWGLGDGKRNRVVVILEWTGQALTGVINPGPNAIPVKSATVDPMKWSLQLEAEGRDAQGQQVAYRLEGVIDDLGTYNRTLSGSWSMNGAQGDFSITRQ